MELLLITRPLSFTVILLLCTASSSESRFKAKLLLESQKAGGTEQPCFRKNMLKTSHTQKFPSDFQGTAVRTSTLTKASTLNLSILL